MLALADRPYAVVPVDHIGSGDDERIIEMWLYDKSLKTQNIYRRVLRSLLGDRTIRTLTLNDFYHWIDSLAKLKVSTQRSKIYAVKSLLSFAHKIGYTSFNIGAVVKPPRAGNEIHRKCLKPSQVRELADASLSPRDRLIIRLGYVAGLRASEISGLTWGCLQGDVLTFVGKGGKQRSVKLPQTLVIELGKFQGDALADDPIFKSRKGVNGGHLDGRSITRIIKAASVASGNSPKVSAHWLRHSHAYNALQSGVSVALIRDTLGHASLATTSQYLAISPDDSSAMSLSI